MNNTTCFAVVKELGDCFLRFELMSPWIRFDEIRDLIEEFKCSFEEATSSEVIDEGCLLKCLGLSNIIARKIAELRAQE